MARQNNQFRAWFRCCSRESFSPISWKFRMVNSYIRFYHNFHTVVVCSLCGSRRKPPRFIQMGPATSPDIFGLICLKKGIIIPDMLLLVDRTGPYLPIPSIIYPFYQPSRWLGSVIPEMDNFQILFHLLFSVLLFWSEATVVSWKTIFEGSEKSSNIPTVSSRCEWFPMFTAWWQLKYFLFSPRSLGKWANLTNSFQVGWNHQVVYIWTKKLVSFVAFWCILLDIKWHLNQQP